MSLPPARCLGSNRHALFDTGTPPTQPYIYIYIYICIYMHVCIYVHAHERSRATLLTLCAGAYGSFHPMAPKCVCEASGGPLGEMTAMLPTLTNRTFACTRHDGAQCGSALYSPALAPSTRHAAALASFGVQCNGLPTCYPDDSLTPPMMQSGWVGV
jgi:hypothetical protein